jgi:hypothetical protein
MSTDPKNTDKKAGAVKPKRLTKKAALAMLMPRNEAEVCALIAETIKAQTVREEAVALRDGKLADAAAEIEEQFGYDEIIQAADVDMARNVELLEMWADQHPEVFGDLKSVTRAGASFGWRLGQWKTQLKSKVTWEMVVDYLTSLVKLAKAEKAAGADGDKDTILLGELAKKFIRVCVEPNKVAMIAERENVEAVAVMEAAGVVLNQEERFYFEPLREGQAGTTLTGGEG